MSETTTPRPGFISRMRAQLNTGDSWLTYDLANLMPGGGLDDDALEELDIGILGVASIPVAAMSDGIGEFNVPVNFGGVTFLPDDHLYVDTTGVILSPEPLDIE